MSGPASAIVSPVERPSVRSLPRADGVLWRAVAGAALALGVIYFLVGPTAQTVIYQAFSAGALVAIVVGVRRYKPVRSHHWSLFAAGLAMWCIGDLCWDSYNWILGTQAPYPSFAELAYSFGYLFFIAGVVVLARGWGLPRIGDVLDGLIVVVAAAILTQLILLEPILGAESSSTLGTIAALGTPVADVLLLAGLTQIFFRNRAPNFALRCIVLAIVATLAADVVYSYLNLEGLYTGGMPIDAGWLAFYALWAVAALHPSMARIGSLPETKSQTLSVRRIALLLVALLAAPTAVIGEAALGKHVDAYALGALAILTTLLVGIRVVLLQRDRKAVQAALAESESRYRELFQEAEGARAALHTQNEQLRQVDGLKDDLIALVSHELRTPLTSIVGYLELVQQDEDELKKQHRDYLEVVNRNAHRLLSLVSDLLFAAEVQAGRVMLEKDLVSMRELVEQSVAASLPTATERQIDVTVRACEVADVIGDRQRLGQVIDNLLSNALKFTPPNGKVGVSVSILGGAVVLEVEDSGIGISSADQRRLFSRFFRTETAMRKEIQGSGLGLSIVKAVVEGHGGEITVKSAEGEGSTFRIVLPVAARSATEPMKQLA